MSLPHVPRRVFVVWHEGPMTAVRVRSLEMIRQTVGVEVVLVDKASLPAWVVPDAPLPRCFPFLSAIHKADYLRCYLMHHHGGGYVDLKPVDSDWRPEFDRLEKSPRHLALGYREPGRQGVATFGLDFKRNRVFMPLDAAWWRYRWLQLNYRRLMGTVAFIFRPRTPLTHRWFAEVTRKLDGYADALAAHPASHPRDHFGFVAEGRPSQYPIPWSAILGDILHPLSLEYRRQILHTLEPPRFTDYQ